MKFAVAIQSIRDLKYAKEPWKRLETLNEIEMELQTDFFSEWEEMFGEKETPDRIIFGSEFCQYRLPSKKSVKQALDYCWDQQLDFSFATPYVHEQKFQQLLEILEFLNGAAMGNNRPIEVIVNDWGVFHYVREHFQKLDIVIGRLLNKSIRDPRVAHYYTDPNAPKEGKDFYKKTGLLSEPFQQFLSSDNVTGYEFDQLIQGNSLSKKEAKQIIGLHFPFGCVASGSACMVGFMETEKSDKFRGDPECKQQCQLYIFELKNKRHHDMRNRVFQKGTTAFYSHDRSLVKSALKSLQGIENARAVYSLRMPV
ncbi:hypothetical protein J2S13_002308 [Oikeobacillus pervagus]|uniref:Uncharacterized protein n=1 Tax=Oikeobacillus pervagus TaxID=1325931 RepID=A0AAJ1SZX9_9BACI|nr:hypothetical protein [Oikeobacillus pervagus]MDQ0215888.1 hypothetical protein [Oikeobacillus pervagus]